MAKNIDFGNTCGNFLRNGHLLFSGKRKAPAYAASAKGGKDAGHWVSTEGIKESATHL